MNWTTRLILIALVAFAAALGGTYAGRVLFAPERQSETALLQNKVMDSHEESFVIDGRDAQTDASTLSHDQLARV